MLVCSIYNDDVKEFGALMMFPSKKVAISSFLNWIDGQTSKHFDPFDFRLVWLADFDIQKGTFRAKKDVIELASGKEYDIMEKKE